MKKLRLLTVFAVIAVFLFACAPKYELRFIVDGEVIETATTDGETISNVPLAPEKEGYYFEGWFINDEEGEKPFDLVNLPTKNTDIYAKYTQKQVITVAQPTYNGEQLRYGDPLPQITTVTEGGFIWLDDGQELKVGTHEYDWTFVPQDLERFIWQNTKGKILLSVTKGVQQIQYDLEISASYIGIHEIALISFGPEYEYSIDAQNWQDSTTFTGLNFLTPYTFYARLKETENYFASSMVSMEFTTLPNDECNVIALQGFEFIDGTHYIYVSNSTETFDFTDIVTVSDGASWVVSSDRMGQGAYSYNIVPLNEGENTVWIVVTAQNGTHKSGISVTVNRLPATP